MRCGQKLCPRKENTNKQVAQTPARSLSHVQEIKIARCGGDHTCGVALTSSARAAHGIRTPNNPTSTRHEALANVMSCKVHDVDVVEARGRAAKPASTSGQDRKPNGSFSVWSLVLSHLSLSLSLSLSPVLARPAKKAKKSVTTLLSLRA